MLGLHPSAGKEEIRRAYKGYVRIMHPDLNGGEAPDEDAIRKFQKLTDAYNEVMNMTDDQFWLESFDTGITRMATKRVDGPSLNPWERRFRKWARKNDLLDVDTLSDDDVDCRTRAKLYLEACEEDPTLEGCDIAAEIVSGNTEQWRAATEMQDDVEPAMPADSVAASSSNGMKSGIANQDGNPFRIENILVGGVLTAASGVILAVVAIIASAVKG